MVLVSSQIQQPSPFLGAFGASRPLPAVPAGVGTNASSADACAALLAQMAPAIQAALTQMSQPTTGVTTTTPSTVAASAPASTLSPAAVSAGLTPAAVMLREQRAKAGQSLTLVIDDFDTKDFPDPDNPGGPKISHGDIMVKALQEQGVTVKSINVGSNPDNIANAFKKAETMAQNGEIDGVNLSMSLSQDGTAAQSVRASEAKLDAMGVVTTVSAGNDGAGATNFLADKNHAFVMEAENADGSRQQDSGLGNVRYNATLDKKLGISHQTSITSSEFNAKATKAAQAKLLAGVDIGSVDDAVLSDINNGTDTIAATVGTNERAVAPIATTVATSTTTPITGQVAATGSAVNPMAYLRQLLLSIFQPKQAIA